MTTRSEPNQRLLELKQGLISRLAGRAMTTRTSGLDGLAKSLLRRQSSDDLAHDSELDHPEDWDRPID